VPTSLLWFRRDLRLNDHPALAAARDEGDVLPVFVLDPRLWDPAGAPRRRFLLDALADLDQRLDGHLVVRRGDPATVLPKLAREVEASAVHVSADTGPYGRARDEAVEKALGEDVPLIRTGSPYAVTPGRVTKDDGTPFRVFTPFARAWREHGWRDPAPRPRSVPWAGGVGSDDLPSRPDVDARLPPAGEDVARAAWRRFRDERLPGYADARNLPATDATSRMSVYLKYGLLHPRTLLADLAEVSGAKDAVTTFTNELAWREFYADVLWHRPETHREAYDARMGRLRYDRGTDADARFAAWTQGRTGYPIVDAGLRQLLGEAWMHNRVRMIVASFLTKDLHVDWWRGARHFLAHLVDGDLASNNHGWQWVAGTGTDASPYYRVFNPVTQGKKFDPDGGYVRRWVPELRDLPDRYVHEPWRNPDGIPDGYPAPIVEHAHERRVALDRYDEVRAGA
jgi:deoxyribodipyrimidine photo-lyase